MRERFFHNLRCDRLPPPSGRACRIRLPFGDDCGLRPRAPSARDPESAANAFFAAVETGDARAAYDSSAFGFRATETYDAFISNARELGIVGGKAPGVDAQGGHPFRSAAGREHRQRGWTNDQYLGNPDRDRRRVEGVFPGFGDRAATTEKTHNLFKVVGTGAGVNDVYHQPMPTQEQLAKLVHETMDKFNTAVEYAGFPCLLRLYLAAVERMGSARREMRPRGLRKICSRPISRASQTRRSTCRRWRSRTPVFDQPPVIDQDGLLDLQGHFDTSKFRVAFLPPVRV